MTGIYLGPDSLYYSAKEKSFDMHAQSVHESSILHTVAARSEVFMVSPASFVLPPSLSHV